MTSLILGSIFLLTLLIAATVEVLAQRSQAHGGLAISSSLETIPYYAMWSYLYGPNLVAVLYSFIWNWVDLDARRMQPWFELSKPEGATAEDSLLLDYPFDFVAIVPWKSAKKRYDMPGISNDVGLLTCDKTLACLPCKFRHGHRFLGYYPVAELYIGNRCDTSYELRRAFREITAG